MEIKKIKEGIYYIEDSTNMPLLETQEGFLIFDSPIDKDKAKKVRRLLDERGFIPKFLILSHHHADHTGGASFLKENYNLEVLSSEIEKAFIETPIIEPVYLSQGSSPPEEFLTKWIKSTQVKIDRVIKEGPFNLAGLPLEIFDLSGHSIGMIGIKVDSVIFSADAFFSLEVLKKYIMPYFHDKDKYIEKMTFIKSQDFEYILPSHGTLLSREEAVRIIDENIRIVEEIGQKVLNSISSPKTVEEILEELKIPVSDFVVSYLIKSSLHSILFSLLNKGRAKTRIENSTVRFVKKSF